jgi:hypothetical protein
MSNIDKALASLVEQYGKEDWFCEAKIASELKVLLLYTKCDPKELALPASWKQIPLYLIKSHRRNRRN